MRLTESGFAHTGIVGRQRAAALGSIGTAEASSPTLRSASPTLHRPTPPPVSYTHLTLPTICSV
eukprot:4290513-Prymnesium_polylepis.1